MVLSLAACDKENPVSSSRPDAGSFSEGRITFLAATESTKAVQAGMTETVAATLQSGGFKAAAAIGTNEYFNEVASFVDVEAPGTDYFATAGTYYYPMASSINFWGVYPASQAITVSGGAATLSYTSVGTVDLVGAKATAAAASSGATALAFDHLLSQVKVSCHGTDAVAGVTYTVTDIKLVNKATGIYSYSGNSWGTLGSNQTWDLLDAATAASNAAGTYTDMGTVPSVIPAACTLTISWDTYQDGAKVATYTESADFTPTMGKLCNVKCNLPNSAAQPITFTITVNAWGSESTELTFDGA